MGRRVRGVGWVAAVMRAQGEGCIGLSYIIAGILGLAGPASGVSEIKDFVTPLSVPVSSKITGRDRMVVTNTEVSGF